MKSPIKKILKVIIVLLITILGLVLLFKTYLSYSIGWKMDEIAMEGRYANVLSSCSSRKSGLKKGYD